MARPKINKIINPGSLKTVGQSKDVAKRLKQHSKSAKFKSEGIAELKVTEVKGGKTSREIVEQQKLDHPSVGGRDGIGVLNEKNPIGPNRSGLEKQVIPTGNTRTLKN